jgi:dolichol-phosphate mannosyltransferase
MTELENYIQSLRGPILVMGASGFVGANLFKTIAKTRDDVFAVVKHDKSWRLSEVKDEQIIALDINDYTATMNLLQQVKPQTVFDCMAYGAYSFEKDTSLIYQTNFMAVVNFIELLSKQVFSAYVHAGSSSEYGMNCAAPSEEAQCVPNSPYAVSKVAMSSYLYYMGKQQHFPCINLRLYSVYGPLEDTSRLFPNLLRKALQGELPPFVDPKTSRDFIYIDDVCEAFIRSAVKINPSLFGESFNIGSGNKTTIFELAYVCKRLFQVEAEPQFGTMDGRSWDLADWYSNPTKAWTQLGWRSTTTLEEGLQLMMAWVRQLSDEEMKQATKIHLTKRKRSISAIIACYKDEQAISVMHHRLTETFQHLGIDYEIIFVNDGSPDHSAEVIREISEKDPRVLGITHSRNFGSQMAFRSGMELSSKDGVVLLDGDLQDPPELIASFYEQWEKGYDVVYGRRIKRDMPWHWEMLYRVFYRLFALFSYVSIPLDAGDFSLMDRRIVHWLLQFPERDLFVRGIRAYVGFKQVGVDYIRPERMFGVSTNNLLKNIEWAKKGIFSFSNTPLTILTSTGVVMLAISILLAVIVAALRVVMPDIAPKGVTTLLIFILFFGSLNLFAIGLVGEYVSKILIEVKGRPRLIRAGLIRNGVTTNLLPDGKSHSSL